jgi:hypothetical protein
MVPCPHDARPRRAGTAGNAASPFVPIRRTSAAKTSAGSRETGSAIHLASRTSSSVSEPSEPSERLLASGDRVGGVRREIEAAAGGDDPGRTRLYRGG